jgi:hypothetical protein
MIIDALDECDDGEREDIVMLIWNLEATTGNCLTVCLASRPINDLPKGFKSDSRCHHLLLQENTKQDIKNYMHNFLRDLHLSNDSQSAAHQYILKQADGVFVWVHLFEKDLRRHSKNGCSQELLMGILMSLPTDVEKYYEFMLQQLILNEQFYTGCGIKIFQTGLFSHCTLTFAEVGQALAVSTNEQRFNHTLSDLERNMPRDIQCS